MTENEALVQMAHFAPRDMVVSNFWKSLYIYLKKPDWEKREIKRRTLAEIRRKEMLREPLTYHRGYLREIKHERSRK